MEESSSDDEGLATVPKYKGRPVKDISLEHLTLLLGSYFNNLTLFYKNIVLQGLIDCMDYGDLFDSSTDEEVARFQSLFHFLRWLTL